MTATHTDPQVGAFGSGPEVLDAVVRAAVAEKRAAAEKLAAALAWAHAHPGVPGDCASWDPQLRLCAPAGVEDHLDQLGGDGTPAVAEFAVEQLATRLAVSTGSAMGLVANALNLAHRHPVLWARVQELSCPAWVACRVATECSALPAEGARWVDTVVGQLAGRCAWKRITAQVAYALAKWCPQTAKDAEDQARDGRKVEVMLPDPGRPGTAGAAVADLRGRLSTTDAVKFDALVAAKADELARAGDTASLDVRRSKALGLIADQLMSGELDLDCCADGEDNHADKSGSKTVVPARKAASSMLYLHLSLADLAVGLWQGQGADLEEGYDELDEVPVVGWVEKYGPVMAETVAEWLQQTNATIRPVLDLRGDRAVDRHDPPETMREQVILRDGHCVFPWCGTDARAADLDHIEPWLDPDRGGPPGQTRPGNLAPLCRRHHRAKTFTRWRYHRRPDGTYEWTDPGGQHLLVIPRGGGTYQLPDRDPPTGGT